MYTSSVPANNFGFQLNVENGIKYFGNHTLEIFPIHPLSETLKNKFKNTTHHYCGVFTKDILSTISNKVFVNGSEYEVNKIHRVLIASYDGKLNLWQNAPTFKSKEHLLAGLPITDASGNIVSIITGSKNEYYAIASFDGYSGKFETTRPWLTVDGSSGIIYGNKVFKTRFDLHNYLKGREFGSTFDLQAIVVDSPIPRVILFDLLSGLELSHSYIRGEFVVTLCDKYH